MERVKGDVRFSFMMIKSRVLTCHSEAFVYARWTGVIGKVKKDVTFPFLHVRAL
jgi:hypothetical protein